ncbi:estrogen sulfotransferase-like [Brachionus plicatilis]|uniref:Estrogen sulfotransferase-like n=1 Tax=Brachionus plicatilis TaxID=10195 RepID=A0A3M7PRQ8_BRAPC|nr:estrogen sulfotransferase-like [Brachionus plicatilis]
MNRLCYLASIGKNSIRINVKLFDKQKYFLIKLSDSSRFLASTRINFDKNLQSINNTDKNSAPPPPKKEISPIRKLLFVKDYLDLLIIIFLATGIYIGYKNSKLRKDHEKKFNIEWLDIPFTKHKIFTCNNFFLPEFVAKSLEKFKQFEVRPDDVWIVSFPKSGTTWVQELVYLIENECDFKKATQDSIENRSPFFDYPSPGLKHIQNIKSKRIIKTHLPRSFLPDDIEKKAKVIYIVRNPKDVTVSYFHFTNLSTQAQFTGNFYDFTKLFIEGKVPYGPWWSHVDDYLTKEDVHLIYYEDLHTRPFEVIKELSKYLGKDLSDDQIKSIIDWCSFDKMKNNPAVNYEWYKELGLYKKNGHFFRKGKIGDWLNHFAVDDSQQIDLIVENKLKTKLNFNYGICDEDLEKIYSVKNTKSL